MSSRFPFRPKQSLGQNFLHDPNMAEKIVDTLQAPPEAHVVEVGAGTGELTTLLADRYEHLTAIEIDERAVAVLREKMPALDVRQADVLETNWPALAAEKEGPLYVISNMPYYLTSELLFALLEHRSHVAEAVLTMQKAVAERLVAEPKTKAYGILSVLLQLFSDPKLCYGVPPQVFTPQPDVSSAVVRITFGDEEAPEDLTLDDVRPYVRAAFNQRRKMLRNSLSAWAKDQDVTLPNDWGRKRAEALMPDDFAELARFLNAEADPVEGR
ncbi:ribosomal RNA small subunit methyltransferase A [Salinibacter sp. 10B]|uniref:16S rRNA (adenine(1518)-N(6)/adenine(1519)-N(6))- dimethyltransferase RsmA n=1 Tax=Salinibacter sp. 10B TaxID=1923971 RepID=UPI000CF37637|nr:16S rRNA (adenine(1518)-N(6)/adenine(1519)-N(6))-dimethyltransferase RsmA [Salinibacter sp. 10B]PQJ34287.1 ribosomal RNA small subunit methyltransferase A [Salinibacter sp. 10B]